MPDSPARQMLQMLTGYWVAQAIHVAAKLGIADLVAAGPVSSDELAKKTNTHPHALFRLLRALASVGVFQEVGDRKFALTPLAETLLDRPGSKRAPALMMGAEHYDSWGELLYSVQTGKTGFEKLYGQPIFDYLSQHPEEARIFDAAMTGIHGEETQAMIDAYDFSGIGTLADVGGGNGSLLSLVLQKNPKLKGLLFDLPNVIARAQENLKANGVADRCQTATGSFFDFVPPSADAYLMRHIIHDWYDPQCLTILKNIRKVIPATGRLLVVEIVIEPGNEPGWGKFLDLNMLVLPGGMERTEPEYRDLFARAGFELSRIVPTKAQVSIVEGRPV